MRAKILLLCLGSTLLALGLQTWFFQASASSLIFRLEQEASEKSLVRMQDELYSWIKGYENNLIKVYNQADLMQSLAHSPQTAGAGKNSRTAYTMMQSVFSPDQSVNALYLYTMDHRLVSYSRVASTPRFFYPEDIYRDPLTSRASKVLEYVASDDRVMLVTGYYNASREQTIVRLVLKLYSNNTRTKIGYWVCDVDPKTFRRIVAKYVYSDRQLVWLQPPGDSPLVVHGRREGRVGADYDAASNQILGGSSQVSQDPPVRGNVFLSRPQQKYGLTAFSLVPQDLLEESQTVLTRNMLVIAFLVVLVALAAVSLVTRWLTTPLTRMMEGLGKIREGQTDLRLDGLKADEIGVLGRSINQMLDRIQELMAQEYEAALHLRQAEYMALQAQINPHFLYNTLDTMNSIATAQQAPTVAALCQAMSNLFRYSLDMKQPLATVGSEIVHLKNYLYVMNVRTSNGLEVEFSIDQSLLDARVPRLCLQPLVENSINHGLKNKRGIKTIRIHGEVVDQVVKLTVEDNGVGLDANEMNRRLRAAPQVATGSDSSIGLSNIHARIGLLFGAEYGVEVVSTPGQGSAVSVTVPRHGTQDLA